jgi:hypothetical protein
MACRFFLAFNANLFAGMLCEFSIVKIKRFRFVTSLQMEVRCRATTSNQPPVSGFSGRSMRRSAGMTPKSRTRTFQACRSCAMCLVSGACCQMSCHLAVLPPSKSWTARRLAIQNERMCVRVAVASFVKVSRAETVAAFRHRCINGFARNSSKSGGKA